MDSNVVAALWGAVVGGVLTLMATVLQHFLSLREDNIKREREEIYAKSEELRRRLLAGGSEAAERGRFV